MVPFQRLWYSGLSEILDVREVPNREHGQPLEVVTMDGLIGNNYN